MSGENTARFSARTHPERSKEQLEVLHIGAKYAITENGTITLPDAATIECGDLRTARAMVWRLIHTLLPALKTGSVILIEDARLGSSRLAVSRTGPTSPSSTPADVSEEAPVPPSEPEAAADAHHRPAPTETRHLVSVPPPPAAPPRSTVRPENSAQTSPAGFGQSTATPAARAGALVRRGGTVAQTARTKARTRKAGAWWKRKPVLISAAALVMALMSLVPILIIAALVMGGSTPEPTGTPSPQWSTAALPEGMVPVTGSGSVFAGVGPDGKLMLANSSTGEQIPTQTALAVPDPAQLKVATEGEVVVVDPGTGSGVLVANGSNSKFLEGMRLMSRSAAPVLLGKDGSGKDASFTIGADLAPAQIQIPQNSVVFARDQGTTIFAVFGGKVITRTAPGTDQQLTLTPPVPTAKLKDWVTATATVAVVTWQLDDGTASMSSYNITTPKTTQESTTSVPANAQIITAPPGETVTVTAVPGADPSLYTITDKALVNKDRPEGSVLTAGTWCVPPGQDGAGGPQSWDCGTGALPGEPIARAIGDAGQEIFAVRMDGEKTPRYVVAVASTSPGKEGAK